MVSQEFDSCDNAVQAERKSTHTMIAGRTQPARALIALNHRRILSMVATVHHLLKPIYSDRYHPAYCPTSAFADPHYLFVPAAPAASAREFASGNQR